MKGYFEKRSELRKPSRLREITPKLIIQIVSDLSFFDRLKLRIQGSLFLDDLPLEGWSQETPVYLFKCKHHGYELSYPSGYFMGLPCLDCVHEQINHIPFRPKNILKKLLFENKHREDVDESISDKSDLEQVLYDEK